MKTPSRFSFLSLMLVLSFVLKAEQSEDPKGNFKVNMFPMLGDRTCLSFERCIDDNKTVEVGVEGLGLFSNNEVHPDGLMVGLGIRFYQLAKDDNGTTHPMSGLYFAPTFKAGYAGFIKTYGGGVLRENVSSNYFMGLLQAGNQFVIYKRFCLDFTIGAGVLVQDNPGVYNSIDKPYFRLGFLGRASNQPDFVVSGSVRLGYAFL